MPRRDALSEKKRERLMQENEQLQKLMLQARSSVRRSSLKDQPEQPAPLPEETDSTVNEELKNIPEAAEEHAAEKQDEKGETEKEPLTENDLFPISTAPSESSIKKPPLTEKELFPEVTTSSTAYMPPPKSGVVNVILPGQNVAASVAERNTAPEEATRYSNVIHDVPEMEEDRTAPGNGNGYEDDPFADQRARPKTGSVVVWIVVVLLAGAAGYYFYITNMGTHAAVATRNNRPVSTPTTQPQDSVAITGKELKLDDFQKTDRDEPGTASTAKPSVEVVAAPKKETAPPATTKESLGQYKVISKAYFHDEPDESTRRKAFIIHWNNTVLTPLDEKNGFVYIIFTNHLGQTTKGWLRKQDLKRMDE